MEDQTREKGSEPVGGRCSWEFGGIDMSINKNIRDREEAWPFVSSLQTNAH